MATTAPLVTVLVQTYQHSKYIEKCILSIINQVTNFEYEIVIGEDSSSDGTREICIKLQKQYPDKIKLVLRDRKDVIFINGRATGRYNFMQNILSAKGKYIAFCEGDDYWVDNNKLQTQVDFLEANEDYVLCFTNAIIDHERKSKIEKKYFIKPGKLKSNLDIKDTFTGWFIPTATIVYRRPVNFTFPDWYDKVMSSDIALVSILAQYGKLKFIDTFTAAYRINSGGISNQHRGTVNLIISRIQMYQYLNQYYELKYDKEIKEGINYLLLDYTAENIVFKTSKVIKHLYLKVKKQFSKYLIHMD